MQGVHQVAQKLITRYFPRVFFSVKMLPFVSVRLKESSGADSCQGIRGFAQSTISLKLNAWLA